MSELGPSGGVKMAAHKQEAMTRHRQLKLGEAEHASKQRSSKRQQGRMDSPPGAVGSGIGIGAPLRNLLGFHPCLENLPKPK